MNRRGAEGAQSVGEKNENNGISGQRPACYWLIAESYFLKEAPVSQSLFIQARELIKEKRYDEARAILRGIDHPTAREWLAKLDKLAPEPPVPESAPAEPETPPQAAAPAPWPMEQLLAAREHLTAKRYDEARAMLRDIDHPTAREWLAKLDKLAPEPPPAASHDEIIREAQRLLLQGEYDRVRDMLKPLNTSVAAFWLDKTAVNQFRSHENLWLDMFRYDLPSDAAIDPATWKCPVCLRKSDQAPLCPQRGESSCPMKLIARKVEEPRRLALILEALQHDQARSIDKLTGSTELARLENWQDALIWQAAHLLEPDIRRPAIEAAIELLGQLIDQRRA
jgi:DNA-binding transcriptional ArsR family regulator